MAAKRRNQSILILFFLIFALILAGAAGQTEVKEEGVQGEYSGTKIRILAIPHPASDAMRAMTPEFEKATGITVEWELVGSSDIMSKQFLAQTAQDVPYDVYMAKGVYLAEYEIRNVLADLSVYLDDPKLTPPEYDYEDLIYAYREGLGTFNNNVRGIPVAGESFFISYRKDLFDKYGKQAPDTTEDLLELAKFFHEREPGLYGISMRAETGRTFALAWDLFTAGFGGAIIDQQTWEIKINTPETIESLKYFLELLKYAPPDIETYSWDAAISAFAAGKTAMWYDATSLQPWIVDPEKSEVIGKVAYTQSPLCPEGRFGPVGGWVLSIPELAKNKGAGWAFISWMTSRVNAKEYVANGGVPCRNSNLDDPELIAQDPNFMEALKGSLEASGNLIKLGQRWVPATTEAKPIHKVAGFYGGEALLGKMSAEEACAAAVPELEEIRAKILQIKY